MSLYDGVGVDTGLTSDSRMVGDTQAQGVSLSKWHLQSLIPSVIFACILSEPVIPKPVGMLRCT